MIHRAAGSIRMQQTVAPKGLTGELLLWTPRSTSGEMPVWISLRLRSSRWLNRRADSSASESVPDGCHQLMARSRSLEPARSGVVSTS